MTITHTDLGVTEDLGRRILLRARIIAPCIDSFPDGSNEKKDAIAVLKGVIAELPDPGARRARSLSRNGTSISFSDIESVFDGDATVSLRALCGQQAARTPEGSFPASSVVPRVWPEERYS